MTRIQYLRALALARAFGHEWGYYASEADEPASVEDIQRLHDERCANVNPASEYEQRSAAGCGIMAPTESEPWRSLDHVTATGRLRWSIKANGDVLIDLHRPDHSKYLARLWVAGDRAGCAGIDTALSIHARHVDALREALIALVPEELADAALADVASRALPDEVTGLTTAEAIERLLGECERRIEDFDALEVRRVAAAIAKLDKAPEVRCAHVAEAIQYDQSGGLDVCAWRLRGTPAGSRAWSVLATLAHIDDDPRRDSSTDPRLA